MSSAASVGGDERLRLFLALRLPDDVLDEVERWQREHLRDVRAVRREHLHVTLAFLGHRPAGELEAIAGALREAAAGAGEIRLAPARYRETRRLSMSTPIRFAYAGSIACSASMKAQMPPLRCASAITW